MDETSWTMLNPEYLTRVLKSSVKSAGETPTMAAWQMAFPRMIAVKISGVEPDPSIKKKG